VNAPVLDWLALHKKQISPQMNTDPAIAKIAVIAVIAKIAENGPSIPQPFNLDSLALLAFLAIPIRVNPCCPW
jgi:hypothetical protein